MTRSQKQHGSTARHAGTQKTAVGDQPICSEQYLRQIDPVWVFGAVPTRFWHEPENRRKYLLWLGHRLRFRRMCDWYRLTYEDIANNHGAGVVCFWWRSSPVYAVKECFPEYDWEEWQFVQVPRTFWRGAKNRRRYMTWLGQRLGFSRVTDWYQVTTENFQQHRGGALLLEYNSSVSATVKACFPGYDWKEWMFNRLPQGFWDDLQNCRRYMQWLGRRLHYQQLDDWYRVKASDFIKNYGRPLLRHYRDSVAATVIAVVPRSQWCEWMFTRVPPRFWDDVENRRRYVQWLGRRLGYREMADWAQVSRKDFKDHFGGWLIMKYRSCWDLLEECFPQFDWQPYRREALSIETILGWADTHFAAHDQWPIQATTTPISGTSMTWRSIDASLRCGLHGLPGGTSLARLLEEHRGKWVAKRPHYPTLSERQIAAWQKSHRKATGQWPTEASGPVAEAPDENWFAISRALRRGNRGLPRGSGLAKVRQKFGLEDGEEKGTGKQKG